MLQPIFDVDVHCLCVGSVSGVVCFSKLRELQGGTAVCSGCWGVLHFRLVYSAKLGIIV